MNRQEFLTRLSEGIASLPPQRIQEIEEDIFRHFDEGHAAGASDDALADMLGDPDILAREYVSLYTEEGERQKQPESYLQSSRQSSAGNYFTRAMVILGLGLLNLTIVLPLSLAIFVVWLSLAVASVAMVLAGIVGLLAAVVNVFLPVNLSWILNLNGTYYPAVAFFGCIASSSLGGLLWLGIIPAGKWGLTVCKRYVYWNLAKISGQTV